MTANEREPTGWTFLTNHAHVLICLARNPELRLAEVAQMVGIGERATHRIVHELEAAGYLQVDKDGRRNVYTLDLEGPLRHPLEADWQIGVIVEPLLDDAQRLDKAPRLHNAPRLRGSKRGDA